MANLGYDTTLVPTGTVVTASGAGAAVEIDNRGEYRGQVVVAAASGTTPSMTVAVQTSHDGGVSDPWRTLASFPAVTAAGSTAYQSFPGLDRFVRASWTVSGTTPSFTFGIPGETV